MNIDDLPRFLRSVLAAARRRYHALSRTERPPLHQPKNCCGLFAAPEVVELAKWCCWPLPAAASPGSPSGRQGVSAAAGAERTASPK